VRGRRLGGRDKRERDGARRGMGGEVFNWVNEAIVIILI
jgi:hypothetical protein